MKILSCHFLRIAFGGALLLFATNHSNARVSGNDLFEFCGDGGLDKVMGVCGGYIMGSIETLSPLQSADVCFPKEGNPAQIVGAVIKFLGEHPEHRDEIAPKLILDAVTQAFPCDKRKP